MFGELPAVIEVCTLEERKLNWLRVYSRAMVKKAEQAADSLSRFRHKNGGKFALREILKTHTGAVLLWNSFQFCTLTPISWGEEHNSAAIL